MLVAIWVEIAKHTFSLDNFKICEYATKAENNYSSVHTCFYPGISFDITRQFTHLEFFRRILTLDAPKLAVSHLFSNSKRT